MKKRPEIFFEDRGGEGPLAAYWFDGPYGDAVEADGGGGVGFFNEKGRLLAVQFDHIISANDHKTLRFGKIIIEIAVKNGQVIEVIKKQLKPDMNAA